MSPFGVQNTLSKLIRKKHLQKRGFNLAERFAQHLNKVFYKETIISPALHRVRSSSSQMVLTRKKRLSAQKNTLEASSEVKGKTVILVDDILTTGATLVEAQRACLEAQTHQCYAISLVRG